MLLADHAEIVINEFRTCTAIDPSVRFRIFARNYASSHGLNDRSLWEYVRQFQDRPRTEHPLQALSSTQETLIACAALIRAHRKLALRPADLVRTASDFFGVPVSRMWAKAAVRRQSGILRLAQGKIVTKGRVSVPMMADVSEFVEVFERLCKQFPITSDTLINVDETRVSASRDGETGYQVVAALNKEDYNVSITIDTTTLSLLPFVTAGGRCLMVAIVVKGKNFTKSEEQCDFHFVADQGPTRSSRRVSAAPWSYCYCVTKTGYINRQAYLACLRKFAELWQLHHPGLWCYVLADQLQVHKDAAIVKEMMGKKIFFLYFAKNSTHFLQPLDGDIFAAFKAKFRNELQRLLYDAAASGSPAKGLVFIAVYLALEHAMVPQTIRRAWRVRGIWPFDRDMILKAAERWVNKVTSAADKQLTSSKAAEVDKIIHATAAASADRLAAARRRVSDFGASGEPNVVFTCFDVVEKEKRTQQLALERAQAAEAKRMERAEKRKRVEEEKEARKDAKRTQAEARQIQADRAIAARKARICRGPCKRAVRTTMRHVACECGSFFVCFQCNSAKQRLWKTHQKTCKRK